MKVPDRARVLALVRRARRRALEHEFHILFLWVGRASVGWRLHRAFEDFWAALEERLSETSGIYQALYQSLPRTETKQLLAALANRGIFARLFFQFVVFAPALLTAFLLWREVSDLESHNKILEREVSQQVQQGIEARDLNAIQLLSCTLDCPSSNIRKRALQLLISDERSIADRNQDSILNNFLSSPQSSSNVSIYDDDVLVALHKVRSYTRIIIEGVNISDITFYHNINLNRVTFRHSDLRRIRFAEADINSLETEDSDLSGAEFRDVKFTNTSFIRTKMDNVKFIDSCLISPYFTNTYITDTSFHDTYMVSPTLTNIDNKNYVLADYAHGHPRCIRRLIEK